MAIEAETPRAARGSGRRRRGHRARRPAASGPRVTPPTRPGPAGRRARGGGPEHGDAPRLAHRPAGDAPPGLRRRRDRLARRRPRRASGARWRAPPRARGSGARSRAGAPGRTARPCGRRSRIDEWASSPAAEPGARPAPERPRAPARRRPGARRSSCSRSPRSPPTRGARWSRRPRRSSTSPSGSGPSRSRSCGPSSRWPRRRWAPSAGRGPRAQPPPEAGGRAPSVIIADGLRPPAASTPRRPPTRTGCTSSCSTIARASAGLVNVSLHGAPADPRSRAVGTALLHVPDEGWVGQRRGARPQRGGDRPDQHRPASRWPSPSTARAARCTRRCACPTTASGSIWSPTRSCAPCRGSSRSRWGRAGSPGTSCRGSVAAGRATVAGRSLDLAQASAYHDHNWGRWHWGQDLGWEWGCFLAPAPGPAFFLSRIDRPRPSQRTRGSCTSPIPDGRQRTFAGRAVERLRPTAASRPRSARLPGVAGRAPLRPRRARASSEPCSLRADDGTDRVEIRFTARAAAQIIAGDPVEPGYGFVHELVGEFEFAASHRRARGRGRPAWRWSSMSTEPVPASAGRPDPGRVRERPDRGARARPTPRRSPGCGRSSARRRARIRLDDEAVEVRFVAGALVVEPRRRARPRVDGEGATDRATVLDLMDGHLEVSDAISTGALDVVADVDAVAAHVRRDRDPARRLVAEPRAAGARAGVPRSTRRGRAARAAGARPRRSRGDPPRASPARELALLARLDLLPDGAGRPRAPP